MTVILTVILTVLATVVSSPSTPVRSTTPLATRLTGRNASRLLVLMLAAWIIVVAFVAQGAAWVQASLPILPGESGPWVRSSLIQAALIGLPAVLLAWRWRVPRYRTIFQSWAWAAGYGLLLAPTRLLPPVEAQNILLLQLVLTVGYWLVVRHFRREQLPNPVAGNALALAVGALAALPWLWSGALGSPLDLLLNGALAAFFGLLAWTILQSTWLPAQRRDPRRPRRDRLLGGLVMGVTLLLLASAISFNGVQMILMIFLPALGWAVMAAGAPALSIALVVAFPLLLIDPDAMILLATDWLLLYYLVAAGVTVGIGWLLALLAMVSEPDPAKMMPRRPAWVGAGVVIVVAALIYGFVGNPGFYGDRLFVVLADQADLSEVAALPDLAARRSAVYTTLVDHAQSRQVDLRSALDNVRVGYRPYYLVNGLEVNGGLLVRLWLGTRVDVAEVMVSPRMRPAQPFNLDLMEAMPAPVAPQWNLTDIGADRVWQELGVTGEGIVIGQSDSGVQGDHPEFAARYRGDLDAGVSGNDYNWFDPWDHSFVPNDQSGHGTHTLGTILGDTVGVAPGATWFACANLVRNLGNPALYLDCMQFMLAPFPLNGDPLRDGDPSRAADVLNNSWGCPGDVEGCTPTVFAPALDGLTAAGIFVVASAGNEGPLCGSLSAPPAIYEEALSVGAVNEEGDLAEFSSVGPVMVDGSGRIKPEILAPGVEILSAWPGNTYSFASGTSMAGPHVAGVVALLWSANPALRGDIARTRAILQETAQPFEGTLESLVPLEEVPVSDNVVDAAGPLTTLLGGGVDRSCLAQTNLEVVPNSVTGYGIVDAYAAVQAALAAQ